MSNLTEEKIVDKIEVVGDYSNVQVRTATIIKKDGVEISRTSSRHVIVPGQDYSSEDKKVRDICAAVHTAQVKAAYQEYLDSLTPKIVAEAVE